MSRTIAAGLATQLAALKASLCRCLRLDLLDGTSIGITDLDVDISVNLGDGAFTYDTGTGAIPSAISLSVGLESDNLEVRGPVTSLITKAAVLGGRFDQAVARVFDVDFNSPASFMRLLKGQVSESRIEGGEFVLEIRGLQDAFNQVIGQVFSPLCSHDYGDARCQAVVPTWDATIDTVNSDVVFAVIWTAGEPTAAQARAGKVAFTSGALLGTRPMEVLIYDEALNGFVLFSSLAEIPQPGDTLTVYGGCSKLRASSDPLEVTCRTNNNVVNFGGFPDAPGSPTYLKYAIPGAPGA